MQSITSELNYHVRFWNQPANQLSKWWSGGCPTRQTAFQTGLDKLGSQVTARGAPRRDGPTEGRGSVTSPQGWFWVCLKMAWVGQAGSSWSKFTLQRPLPTLRWHTPRAVLPPRAPVRRTFIRATGHTIGRRASHFTTEKSSDQLKIQWNKWAGSS